MKNILASLAVLAAIGCSAGCSGTHGDTGATCGSPGQPAVIASGQHQPDAMAVDTVNVYWTDRGTNGIANGAVQSVPRCGGPVTTVASGQLTPVAIAADSSGVYWANYGQPGGGSGGAIMALRHGDSAPVVLVPDIDGPTDVALDGAHVYFTTGAEGVGGTLLAVPKTGGTPQLLASSPDPFQALAIGADSAYWVTRAGDLLTVPLAGGTPSTLTTGQVGASDVVVDATHVYFSALGDVHSLPFAGGEPTSLTQGGQGATALALWQSRIYYTGFDGVTQHGFFVAWRSLDGATGDFLATGLGGAFAVAADADQAFWTDEGSCSGDDCGTVAVATLK